MALRPEEIDRIKYELGVSPIRLGAEPYIAYLAVFDRVIQPYLFDTSTTATTAVTAAGMQSITLAANPTAASGNGPTFQVGTKCVVDVGPSAETVIVQAITALTVTATFANVHPAGCYFAPYGSEAIVRSILARLDVLNDQLGTIAPTTAGVKRVDDIELFGGGGRGASKYSELLSQRDIARDDLGEAVGYQNLRSMKRGGGGCFEVY